MGTPAIHHDPAQLSLNEAEEEELRSQENERLGSAVESMQEASPKLQQVIASGELTFCHGKWSFFMGKSTISMAIFHGKMLVHQRVATLQDY